MLKKLFKKEQKNENEKVFKELDALTKELLERNSKALAYAQRIQASPSFGK